MSRIGVLNYGTGNLFSVLKSFSEIVECPLVVSTRADLVKVDALVLPGVGHFGSAIRHLMANSLLTDVRRAIGSGLPTLGICLGFQLLCEKSEEDLSTSGFGLYAFDVSRLNPRRVTNIKVPQIGWNSVYPAIGRSILFEGLSKDKLYFYFANSFGVKVSETTMVSTSYSHGDQYFASLESASIFGVQFHPEKSGEQGLKVLENFTRTIR
jgi:glutamine amidotransferase